MKASIQAPKPFLFLVPDLRSLGRLLAVNLTVYAHRDCFKINATVQRGIWSHVDLYLVGAERRREGRERCMELDYLYVNYPGIVSIH